MGLVGPHPVPRLNRLPRSLPLDGVVRIELQEGVPVFRATRSALERVEALLARQRETGLTAEDVQELDALEEVDDWLSFVNRIVRNLSDLADLASAPG